MKYGHFDNEKREYVIDRVDLPTSWTNYLGVKDMCAVLNHTAGGYIFYKSPEYHRITRFRANAVPMDRPGIMCISGMMRTEITGAYPGSRWENRWIRQNTPAATVCPIRSMNAITAASKRLRKCASPKKTRWSCGM